MTHPFSPLAMRDEVRTLGVDAADDAPASAPPAFRTLARAALVTARFVKRIVTVSL